MATKIIGRITGFSFGNKKSEGKFESIKMTSPNGEAFSYDIPLDLPQRLPMSFTRMMQGKSLFQITVEKDTLVIKKYLE